MNPSRHTAVQEGWSEDDTQTTCKYRACRSVLEQGLKVPLSISGCLF